MHPRVYREYERICRSRGAAGAVLEIGAVPSDNSLLRMKSLEKATEKVGINLDGPHEYADFRIVRGNANAMDDFEDDRFDTVLCNAVLEHDKHFWRTLDEIRRVARPGALVVIGSPGYTHLRSDKFGVFLRRLPGIGHRLRLHANWLVASTLTYNMHNDPGDYYRFSTQAFLEVFFEGYRDVELTTVMSPPRIIASGYRLEGPSHSDE